MKSLKTLSILAATLIGSVVALPASADSFERYYTPQQLEYFAGKAQRTAGVGRVIVSESAEAQRARQSASISS